MESSSYAATAPDGNGGIYLSLHNSGAIKDMETRAIECLFVYSVDNAVVRIADPVFIGYCRSKEVDIGSKVVEKVNAEEKVGILLKRNERFTVVEYSEMKAEEVTRTNIDGSLVFSSGNVCMHYFTLNFLKDECAPKSISKEYHFATKSIPFADPETGATKNMKGNNGIKLEKFIFDVFPECRRMTAIMVPRESEFAPVKNSFGSDSANTARSIISNLHKEWLLHAGVTIIGKIDHTNCEVEISPLITYGFIEDLSFLRGLHLQAPLLLQHTSEVTSKDYIEDIDDSVNRDGIIIRHRVRNDGIHVYDLSIVSETI